MDNAVSRTTRGFRRAAAASLLSVGCAFGWATGDPVGPIRVVVDNSLDDPVIVRVAGRRVGEARATGRTFLTIRRVGVAGRRVTVCVDLRASARVLCHAGELVVPDRAEEIWVTVRRGGVTASVL